MAREERIGEGHAARSPGEDPELEGMFCFVSLGCRGGNTRLSIITPGSFLDVSRGPYSVLGIKVRSAVCKAGASPTVLSLWHHGAGI